MEKDCSSKHDTNSKIKDENSSDLVMQNLLLQVINAFVSTRSGGLAHANREGRGGSSPFLANKVCIL